MKARPIDILYTGIWVFVILPCGLAVMAVLSLGLYWIGRVLYDIYLR